MGRRWYQHVCGASRNLPNAKQMLYPARRCRSTRGGGADAVGELCAAERCRLADDEQLAVSGRRSFTRRRCFRRLVIAKTGTTLHNVLMNLRIVTKVVSAAAVTACILGSSSGVATAASSLAPPGETVGAPENSVVEMRLEDPGWDGSVFYKNKVECPVHHPYLVLDARGDNSGRYFRDVTYHTGDGQPLRWNPLAPEYVDINTRPAHYSGAEVRFQLRRNGFGVPGHGHLSLYCANSPSAAHQNW